MSKHKRFAKAIEAAEKEIRRERTRKRGYKFFWHQLPNDSSIVVDAAPCKPTRRRSEKARRVVNPDVMDNIFKQVQIPNIANREQWIQFVLTQIQTIYRLEARKQWMWLVLHQTQITCSEDRDQWIQLVLRQIQDVASKFRDQWVQCLLSQLNTAVPAECARWIELALQTKKDAVVEVFLKFLSAWLGEHGTEHDQRIIEILDTNCLLAEQEIFKQICDWVFNAVLPADFDNRITKIECLPIATEVVKCAADWLLDSHDDQNECERRALLLLESKYAIFIILRWLCCGKDEALRFIINCGKTVSYYLNTVFPQDFKDVQCMHVALILNSGCSVAIEAIPLYARSSYEDFLRIRQQESAAHTVPVVSAAKCDVTTQTESEDGTLMSHDLANKPADLTELSFAGFEVGSLPLSDWASSSRSEDLRTRDGHNVSSSMLPASFWRKSSLSLSDSLVEDQERDWANFDLDDHFSP